MPIQYPDAPQFQVPNFNLLGALAQGEASRLADLQAAKTAQATELAAQKYAQEAEAAKIKQQADELDFAVKNAGIFRDRAMQINPTDPNAQAKYDALLKEFQPKAPSILGGLPTVFNADTQRAILTGHDDFMKLTSPREREAMVDGRSGKALFIFDPNTQTERMVSGSFQGAALPDVKVGDVPYRQTAPGQLSEYTVGAAAPATAPARGQAGAFTAPEITNQVEQIKPGVARVESGGNYEAIGPEVKRKDGVDRAYGKYQVMGANIPSWTEQALGKRMNVKEFLASPEAQEKVFEDQFTRNIKKYGSMEDAVSVWFSGRPLAQAAKAGARDVNMGVPEYVQKVMAGGVGPYKTAKTVPLTGETPSLSGVPVNAFAPMPAPVNAMAMPQSVAAPVNLAPGLGAPQPQAMPLSEAVKMPLKRENTKIFSQLMNKAEEMNAADILPKIEGEGAISRFKKVAEGALPADIQRVISPKAEKLRSEFTNIIDQYIQRLRESKVMTGGEGNTIAELEAKKAMLGKPNMTIEELRDIISSLDANLGTGTLKAAGGAATRGPVTVNVPGHGAVTFPSQEAADAFKREAGL